MYRTFLSTIALLALATLVTAQTPYGQQSTPSTSQTQEQTPAAQSTGTTDKTITGCLSGPNAEGVYELKSEGRTIEIGRNDELKAHVGHEVSLTGKWAKAGPEASEAERGAATPSESTAGTMPEKGESTSSGRKHEAGERHFNVTNITMVSETCKK